jgi:RNA polymerase sigma-70 factor (ECF subfamily)
MTADDLAYLQPAAQKMCMADRGNIRHERLTARRNPQLETLTLTPRMLSYEEPLSESEAISRGNTAVFEAVFKTWYGPLCRYASGLCGDATEAEDLVQQTFVRIWEQRRKIDIRISLKSYLYRAVYHQHLDRERHRKVRQKHKETSQVAVEPLSADSSLSYTELGLRFSAAMKALPEQCALVFRLSRLESLRYKEIAEVLGISVKTVENHMGKALRILREELADYLPLFLLFLIS